MSELVKNAEVTFYSSLQFKSLIQKTGSKFKEYNGSIGSSPENEKNNLLMISIALIEFSSKNMSSLIADVEREKPDLILYDFLSLHTKYLISILRKRYEKKISSVRPPEILEIASACAFNKSYPNNEEMKLLQKNNTIWGIFFLLKAIFLQILFSLKWSLNVINPISYLFGTRFQTLTVTCVFPEFQPRRETYDSSYKFVGCCVSENVRTYDVKDQKLKCVIDSFDPVNPLTSIDQQKLTNGEKKKLIYASLGTVFNRNVPIYEKIINSLRSIESSLRSKNSIELQVILSVGETAFEEFQRKIKNESYKVPENFTIQPFVPQVDILKRASLFITHAGMNSCSEAMHYAVPVVCIPISAEQPLNAIRMEQLNLGICFHDKNNLEEKRLAEAIEKVLTEDSYLKNVIEISKISHKYNGNVNGSNEILNYLKSFEKKDN